MIVYQLAVNEFPFSASNKKELIQIYRDKCPLFPKPTFKDTFPECYRKLIEKCLIKDPKERPSFSDIAYDLKTNSEFITDQIDKEEYQQSKEKCY